jgi:DNA-binding IclR family transcriptional regulator
VSYRVGARHPLSQGAAGKAIALTDPAGSAYAVTSGELQSGARGLAAPVLGVEGLHASVGVVTLDGAIDEDVVAPQVLAAAHEVAARLR